MACATTAAATKAARACLRSAASRASPPSRGSRPNTPAVSATSNTPWTSHRMAGRRRFRCCGGAPVAGCGGRLAGTSGGAHRAGPVPRTALRGDRPPAGSGREGMAAGSARDVEVVADVEDAAGHPGGADHRVVFGPGADVPGQRHGVPVGVHRDVAVIRDQRVPVQRVLDEERDIERVGVVGDLDIVLDVAHAGHRRDGRDSGGPDQVKPTFRSKCPSLRLSTPPPAQCTMDASRMMARITTTTQKKNTMMPGMAYPAMVLALATAASYPPPRGVSGLFGGFLPGTKTRQAGDRRNGDELADEAPGEPA